MFRSIKVKIFFVTSYGFSWCLKLRRTLVHLDILWGLYRSECWQWQHRQWQVQPIAHHNRTSESPHYYTSSAAGVFYSQCCTWWALSYRRLYLR